jgi:acetyl esterase
MLRLPFIVLMLAAGACFAQPPAEMTPTKPAPQFRNVAYGDHERHVLDLWQAPGEGPRPLMIFFHGGGFVGGDKWTLHRALLDACLKEGISVASANYRFSNHQPFPGPMLDGARAVQFLRLHAGEYRLDPKRVAVVGSSAGAGISLWMAYHDEMADAASEDPVLRQSTRVSVVAVYGGQSSYDPRFIRELIGGRAYEHPALPQLYGLTLAELDTPKAYALYEQAAAINYITKDDPPTFGYYYEPKGKLPPGPHAGPEVFYENFGKQIQGQPNPGNGIHHPLFGDSLKAKLDPLGIPCVLHHRDDYAGSADIDNAEVPDLVAFLKQHLS